MAAHLAGRDCEGCWKSVVYPMHWIRLMIYVVEWQRRGWEC